MSMRAAEVEQAMLALDRRDLDAVIHRGIQVLDHGDANDSQEEIGAALARRAQQIGVMGSANALMTSKAARLKRSQPKACSPVFVQGSRLVANESDSCQRR